MELIAIRHGAPEPGGVEDPGLTELGRRQSRAVADHLAGESIDALYVSPLARARQSAEPLAERLGLTAVVEERIAEFDYGSVYHSIEETVALGTDAAMEKMAAIQAPEFRARVLAGVDDMAARHGSETVVAVCHGGVLSVLVSAAVYNDALLFLPEHCSVTRITVGPDGLRGLRSYNECHWIRGL